ncbi:hypothetical protein AAG570_004006 [Ranatra chinensis]|uniref:Uncharacterized protein n=1 Tax=Ranatra chinensis TaxID=642074 RepID=A0ABD0Y2J4_9HEMI
MFYLNRKQNEPLHEEITGPPSPQPAKRLEGSTSDGGNPLLPLSWTWSSGPVNQRWERARLHGTKFLEFFQPVHAIPPRDDKNPNNRSLESKAFVVVGVERGGMMLVTLTGLKLTLG